MRFETGLMVQTFGLVWAQAVRVVVSAVVEMNRLLGHSPSWVAGKEFPSRGVCIGD